MSTTSCGAYPAGVCLFAGLTLTLWAAAATHEPATTPSRSPAVTVEGCVFLDGNGNGKPDAGETGVGDVVISDGLEVTRTDATGHFVLARVNPADRRFVFVVRPSGYRNVGAFYRPLPGAGGSAALSFGLTADPESAQADFSFIQIADLHVADTAAGNGLLATLKQMPPHRPAFVVATGDLVDDGKQAAEFACYAAAIRQSPVPVINVPGNHDIGATPKFYAETLGPERYAFDYGGRHFLVLNSISDVDRQYDWMKRELACQPPAKEVLVFQHYPPDQRLMQFLAGYPTRAIFSGHWHSSKVFRHGKILYVNTPPLRWGGIDISPRTLRRVSFRAGEIMLDDIYPGIGLRAAWTDQVVRPTPVAGAPAPVPGEPWPMFQHDPARTGTTGDPVPPPLQLAWRQTLPGVIHVSSPVVAGRTLYIGVADEENRGHAGIYALDAMTGTRKWHHPTRSSVRHTVSVANGLVYGTTVEGEILAVDAGTGVGRWTFSLGSPLERWGFASPLVVGTVVYAGVAPAFVALDALTGRLLWRAKAMGTDWISCQASPALADGLLVVGFNWGGGLFGLEAGTGNQRWNVRDPAFSAQYATASFSGRTLYDAAGGALHALNLADGKPKWTFPVAGWGLSSAVSIGATVIIGSGDGKIYGVDAATGAKRWTSADVVPGPFAFSPYGTDPAVIASPAVSGKTAYLGTVAGHFLALDVDTGKERWRCNLGAPVTASAAISGNTVYTAAYDGTVYAFVTDPIRRGRPAKGDPERQFHGYPTGAIKSGKGIAALAVPNSSSQLRALRGFVVKLWFYGRRVATRATVSMAMAATAAP